jgi:hypothetical protein
MAVFSNRALCLRSRSGKPKDGEKRRELRYVTTNDPSFTVWYYAEAGQPIGPMTLIELKRQLRPLPDMQDRMVWREGWDEWQRLGDLPEFKRPPAGRIVRQRSARLSGLGFAVGALVAAALGIFIGIETAREFGLNLWIPVICLSIACLAVSATRVPRALIAQLSIAFGQWLWLFAGLALSLIFGTNPTSSVLLGAEIALLGVFIFWLWFAQSKPAVLGLAAYEILGLAYGLYLFMQDGLSVALVTHFVLGLCVLAGAYYAILTLPSQPAAGSASLAQRG